MKTKTLAMIAGAAALYWFLKKDSGSMKGLGVDIFGQDLTAAGVPYNFFTQTIFNPYAPPMPPPVLVTPTAPPPPVYPYGFPMPPGYPPVAFPEGFAYEYQPPGYYQGNPPAPGFQFNPWGGETVYSPYGSTYVPQVVTASGGIQGF